MNILEISIKASIMLKRWIKSFLLCMALAVNFCGGLSAEELFLEIRESQTEEEIAYSACMRYIDEIVKNFYKEMKGVGGLNLVFNGDSSQVRTKIEEIRLTFQACRRATLEEARALHLYMMDRLALLINSHEKIQPFLEESPFSYKRISISISFIGPLGTPSDGTIARVSSISELAIGPENRNRIFYRTEEPFTGDSITLHTELYEEAKAVALVENLAYPFEHQLTDIECIMDKVLCKYLNDLTPQRLECWNIGGKTVDNHIEEIGARFYALYRRASQEEARKFELMLVEKLLKEVNNNTAIRPYLSEYPFPASRLKIRLHFVGDKYMEYKDGSIGCLTLKENELSYYCELRVPTKRPEKYWSTRTFLVGKETYPEAVQKVEAEKNRPFGYQFFQNLKQTLFGEKKLPLHLVYKEVEKAS